MTTIEAARRWDSDRPLTHLLDLTEGQAMSERTCTIEDCGRPRKARGWCWTHYSRWQKHGDTSVVLPHVHPRGRGQGAGAMHPSWRGDDVGYQGAHIRVYRRRGLASAHVCGCGAPAADWAYDHTDPNEKMGPDRAGGSELTYSADPDHYLALCRPCHRALDRKYS